MTGRSPAGSTQRRWSRSWLLMCPAAMLALQGCSCGPPDASNNPDAGGVSSDAGPDAGDAGATGADGGGGGAPDASVPADAGLDCADAGVIASSLAVTETSHLFEGTTAATGPGHFVVEAESGGQLTGTLPTTAAGAYSVVVPLFCGLQTVRLSWPGPVCVPAVKVTVDRQQCTPPDLQVSLTWDSQGHDFELHLIKPGGRINDDASDCTWTSCISSSPDWGVAGDVSDDPHKDIDDTGDYGPENVYLRKPESGVYSVLVEHWGNGLPSADGEVTITLTGGAPVVIPIVDLPSQFVRDVARIDWAARTVTPRTTTHDCTASWSSGCKLPLP